jgi:acetylornithine/succinyldiaminopimelate/putrescine aminotransferase
VEQAKAMDVARMTDLFKAHINPGQLHFMKLLGFHKVKVERAEGMYYYDQNGRKILDFFGGFGSLAFGHNHPKLIEARKKFQDEQRHEIAIAFMSQYATAFAHNLAQCSPGDLDMVFLGSSGSEADGAAIKVAERAAGPNRQNRLCRELLPREDQGRAVDHRRPALSRRVQAGEQQRSCAVWRHRRHRKRFRSDPEIGVIVLETVQGGGGIVQAPAEYWQKLRKLCDQYGVLWVADEVQCGYGRTGRYAFEHYGVAGCDRASEVAGRRQGGGRRDDRQARCLHESLWHAEDGDDPCAATFGGIGEASITAIEGLNVLYDEGLIDNAAATGDYLLDRLRRLQAKYPKIIKDVRGKGLMVGLEFQDFSQTLPMVLRPVVSVLDDKLKGSLSGFVGALLLRDYNVLVAFTEYNRNVIRLEPPLICAKEHVDAFADALDDLLGRGIIAIVKDFVKSQMK